MTIKAHPLRGSFWSFFKRVNGWFALAKKCAGLTLLFAPTVTGRSALANKDTEWLHIWTEVFGSRQAQLPFIVTQCFWCGSRAVLQGSDGFPSSESLVPRPQTRKKTCSVEMNFSRVP